MGVVEADWDRAAPQDPDEERPPREAMINSKSVPCSGDVGRYDHRKGHH